MSKKKFVPLTSLDNLTDEQKTEYKINACEFFGIPAELNLLEFMRLDSGDSGTHLVLYAKKGATDMLRESRGISVDEIKETLGDGFIMFTAKGHDKTGRTDVAVGAADTKGRSGKALSDAIMTAQTRASRRLTLQFVGGGLLDESEVTNTTTNISSATQPLAEIAAPAQLSPNAAPGRDITQEKPLNEAEKRYEKAINKMAFEPDPPFKISPRPVDAPSLKVGDVVQTTEGPAMVLETGTSVPKKRRRRKSEVVLESPGQNVGLPATPANGPTEAQAAAAAALAGVNAVKLAEAAAAIPEAPTPVEAKTCLTCNIAVRLKDGIYVNEGDSTPHICLTQAPLTPKVEWKDQPSEVQKKDFRERLFNYTNIVLRQGKMIPCEGIGGVERKTALFVKTMFSDAKETKYLTVNQWETFLGYLDEKFKELGAEGLVKLINEKIGAKE